MHDESDNEELTFRQRLALKLQKLENPKGGWQPESIRRCPSLLELVKEEDITQELKDAAFIGYLEKGYDR